MKLSAAILLLLAFTVKAADHTPIIENDQVRVLAVESELDAKSALHEHKVNRVMVYLDSGKMVLTDQSGKEEILDFKAGETLWSPATVAPHISHNVSGHAIRIVEIELKNKPGSTNAYRPTRLDTVKVDPRRYKIEFENDQVRVIRAKYGPREKGVPHEHVLNRVVTFLTDANLKVTTPDRETKILKSTAGDVTWGGPAKHIEENLNDKPFEVVVVEIKP